ncbi:PE family protein, partial [Mycobacterium gordonae]|uniref:PE family protein n=1 Tax=Mycobacterium gordonae TaxID=1778 RepID=UPI00210ECA49
MSFLIAAPEAMSTAATTFANVGSSLTEANAAAAAATTEMLPAALDEVSAAVAAIFGTRAQTYQALSVQAAAFHTQFVQVLNAGAGTYAAAESINVGQLLLDVINAPTQALLGRPLIGDGTNGLPCSGANGGAGGLLWGNGGQGGSGAPGQ